MNYRMSALILGEIALITGALMLIPMFMAIGYGEDTVLAFGITIAVCAFLEILGILAAPPKDKRESKPASGFIICGLAWILMSLIGAMPYRISGYIPNYIDALFETVSGFTTTGASILREVESMPKSLLFWRSFTQWIGGMGVLVFIIAILPRNDQTATKLAKAEIPGPQFGKLVSKLRFTAQILYAIYIVLTLIEVGILCAFDMPVFDSFCHAFSTASTGGFSVKNTSIAYYDSVGIDVTITVFMILFSVNFNVYFMILVGQALKAVRSEENLYMFGIYGAAVFLICLSLCIHNTYSSVAEALRYTSFQVASLMSTTGFATADYTAWPLYAQAMLVSVLCIGGSAGSTAGGIKVSRLIILGKSSVQNVKKTLSPRSVYTLKMDGKAVPESTVSSVQSFFVLYIILIFFSTVVISIQSTYSGSDGFVTNLSAVLAAINNVGPGFASVGPNGNYADFTSFAKIVLSLDMLLGRLEILPILLLFYPKAWKRAYEGGVLHRKNAKKSVDNRAEIKKQIQ